MVAAAFMQRLQRNPGQTPYGSRFFGDRLVGIRRYAGRREGSQLDTDCSGLDSTGQLLSDKMIDTNLISGLPGVS